MRKLPYFLSLAAAIALGVTLTGCKKASDNGAPGAAPAQAPIKIGLAAVESGPDAQIGSTMLQGSQVAIDEWNAKGGVLGRQIQSISLDDEGKPDKAVNVAQTLVDAGAVAILGHLNSGCSIPASRVYNQGHVLMITPGSTNPDLTEQGYPYVFRICGRDDQQGAVAGAYMFDVLKLKKIAILHNKTAYGEGLATEVKKTFEAKGGQVVMFQGIGQDETDFSANISVIKGSGAEGFFWGGMYGQGGPICLKMRQSGVNIPFLSGDGCFAQPLIDTVGANAPGVYLTFGPDYHQLPAAQPFLDTYRKKYGQEGAYSVYGYDAANVYLTAVQQAGTTDPDKVAAAMKSTTFDTILGKVEFNDKGDTKASGYVLWTIKDGKFQALPASP